MLFTAFWEDVHLWENYLKYWGFPQPTFLGMWVQRLIGRLTRDPGVLQLWEISISPITWHPWTSLGATLPSNIIQEDAHLWEIPSPDIPFSDMHPGYIIVILFALLLITG